MAKWTFLTKHGAVLVIIARNKTTRVKDIAGELGIGQRSVWRILHDLEDGGYIYRMKKGRLNHFSINQDLPLRRPQLGYVKLENLIKMFSSQK